jgi:hypothetical protein
VTVDKILAERPSKHGEFEENSRATWEIMRALQGERNWPTLTDPEKHALYMIAHKMARVMAGDAKCEDHWDDIAGYATLVAERLRTPVKTYDSAQIYAALALGWNVTVQEAEARVTAARQRDAAASRPAAPPAPTVAPAMPRTAKLVPPEPLRPGTPEDGGHYTKQLEDDIERELSRGFDGQAVSSRATGAVSTGK